MRISNLRRVSPGGQSKRALSSQNTAATFAVSTGEPASGAGTLSGMARLANVDAVVSLQTFDQSDDQKSKATAHGQEVLRELDRLQAGFLSGNVTAAKLLRLRNLVKSRPALSENPALKSILDEVELRAMVELAKLGQV